jgi:hypothetical protein
VHALNWNLADFKFFSKLIQFEGMVEY